MWVNGPIAKEIGMNAGQGFLGPGFRANSTIGRAVSLMMVNIGWALRTPEIGMTGSPDRYCNLVFAENEAESPWESFAVEHGFGTEDSTVTLDECVWVNRMGPSGGMVCLPLSKDLEALAGMVRGLYPALAPKGKTAEREVIRGGAETIINRQYCEVALYPAFARQIAAAGFTKQSLAKWIVDRSRVPWDDMNDDQQAQIQAAAESGKVSNLTLDDCRPGGLIPTFNPEHLAVIVAGGMVGQTIAFCGGGATVIKSDNAGAPEVDWMTKRIHGATLTEAGK
jgi:hypothetical protein